MMRTAISPRFAMRIRGFATRSAPAADNRGPPKGSQTSEMLSEQALSRALERAGLHAPVRFDEVTGSTQAAAVRMAIDGAPEWTLVAASHQTAGRGRLGRTWTDQPGHALLFSLVLRPPLEPDSIGTISLLAGTALTTACRDVAAADATCKWPNDVLVNGRKAGGILAEARVAVSSVEFIVVGIGVNLGSPPSDVPNAAAVDGDETGALLVRVGEAVERVRFGEVEHLQ